MKNLIKSIIVLSTLYAGTTFASCTVEARKPNGSLAQTIVNVTCKITMTTCNYLHRSKGNICHIVGREDSAITRIAETKITPEYRGMSGTSFYDDGFRPTRLRCVTSRKLHFLKDLVNNSGVKIQKNMNRNDCKKTINTRLGQFVCVPQNVGHKIKNINTGAAETGIINQYECNDRLEDANFAYPAPRRRSNRRSSRHLRY
jgi:hypothetical protein